VVEEEGGKLWRVHSGCESVAKMQSRNWFVLPPDQAFYYRQFHANYQPLPEWRADCGAGLLALPNENPISLIYPRSNTQVYIPKDLANERSKVVFKAVHRDPEARLFWHLDNTFLGTTQDFHQQAIWINAGMHTLTLVDEAGQEVSQRFEVLSDE
jgi:penicillin-binding protein 1C